MPAKKVATSRTKIKIKLKTPRKATKGPKKDYKLSFDPRDTKPGDWFWHIHHEVLAEQAYDPIQHRVNFIKTHKSADEIPIRLKLLKPIKGKIPITTVNPYADSIPVYQDRVRKLLDTIRAYSADELNTMLTTRDGLNKLYNNIVGPLGDNVRWLSARIDYISSRVDHAALAKLHAVECPNCPWDGSTIFPKRKVAKKKS